MTIPTLTHQTGKYDLIEKKAKSKSVGNGITKVRNLAEIMTPQTRMMTLEKDGEKGVMTTTEKRMTRVGDCNMMMTARKTSHKKIADVTRDGGSTVPSLRKMNGGVIDTKNDGEIIVNLADVAAEALAENGTTYVEARVTAVQVTNMDVEHGTGGPSPRTGTRGGGAMGVVADGVQSPTRTCTGTNMAVMNQKGIQREERGVRVTIESLKILTPIALNRPRRT